MKVRWLGDRIITFIHNSHKKNTIFQLLNIYSYFEVWNYVHLAKFEKMCHNFLSLTQAILEVKYLNKFLKLNNENNDDVNLLQESFRWY